MTDAAGQKTSDSFHLQKTRWVFGHAFSEFSKGSVIVFCVIQDHL